ncbi:MAG: ferritin [Gemmatimonadota bacterium]
MLSQKLQDAFNEQINEELYSAYLYLSMSAVCADRNLNGFASWMRLQAQEEVAHGMRLFDYLLERGGRVELQQVGQPPVEFGSPLEIMEGALEHEKKVTGLIHRLYEVAVEEGDYSAQIEIQWFITEQVEEENSIDAIVQRMKMFGSDGAALLMVDSQLGGRSSAE